MSKLKDIVKQDRAIIDDALDDMLEFYESYTSLGALRDNTLQRYKIIVKEIKNILDEVQSD